MDSRVPPHDLNAEQGILGSVLIDKDAFALLDGQVSNEDFYRPAHGEIWKSMKMLSDRKMNIDLITLSDDLQTRGMLENCGGRSYLADLTGTVATSSRAESYANIIRTHANRRSVIGLATQVIDEVTESLDPVTMFMDKAAKASTLSVKSTTYSGFQLSSELLDSLDRPMTPVARTGVNQLDGILGMLQKREMLVLAAPPGVGKTAMALQIAREAFDMGSKVLFVSAEMTADELADRMIQYKSQKNIRAIRNGLVKLDAQGVKEFNLALDWLSRQQFKVFQTPSIPSPSMVKSEIIRQTAEGFKPDLVIIDFLTLFRLSKSDTHHTENRVDELDLITQMFRDYAKDFDCHVLVLSQFNREGVKANVPTIHNLRDSGGIGQNAVQAVLMWQDKDTPKGLLASPVNFNVDKNRHGPTGIGKMDYIGCQFTFVDSPN